MKAIAAAFQRSPMIRGRTPFDVFRGRDLSHANPQALSQKGAQEQPTT